MKKETSFICEHSAEFVLVPKFCEILAPECKHITPLYFWRSREGSSAALAGNVQIPIRVVALFARRPKVTQPGQSTFTVKINDDLMADAAYWTARGVPVFAGAPRASTLSDLHMGIPCSWFHLLGDQFLGDFISIRITDGVLLDGPPSSGIEGPLGDIEIASIVQRGAWVTTWGQFVKGIREKPRHNQSGAWLGDYKPVFFVLWP